MSESESQKTNPQSNIPEFSVGELAFSLKKTLEDNFGRVRVRGELSRISIAGSGHLYSSLKDDDAVIDAVCWKGTMSKLSLKPEEGLEVICTGRISSYPKSSKYQLIIESMELAGQGALLKMLEDRRVKLAAEGLFDESRKKPLPFLPETIGVVTSPTGAVIRDILHRLEDRFPRHVLLWPVIVQGDGAADQITAAINGFNALPEGGAVPRPDLMIVGRGGGSLEDLMAFNEENVVRAIADSAIPVISAVGHETDTTLSDYAADLRAPTPTGAAEKAVPVRAEIIELLLEYDRRIIGGMNRNLAERKSRLETLSAKLGDPSRLLETQNQRIDHIGDKLKNGFTRILDSKSRNLIEASSRLRHPKDRLEERTQILKRWGEQLEALGPKIIIDPEKRLNHAGKMLEAYSFENVLKRGFAVIRDTQDNVITTADAIQSGQYLNIQFKNNKRVQATAGTSAKPLQQKPKPDKKSTNPPDQTSLF